VTGLTASRAASAAVLAGWQKATAIAGDCYSFLFLLPGCGLSWWSAPTLLLARVGDVVVSLPALAPPRYKRLPDVSASVLVVDLDLSPNLQFLNRIWETMSETSFPLTLVEAYICGFYKQALAPCTMIVLFWLSGVENTRSQDSTKTVPRSPQFST
jgi:hypothetical protein